MLVLDAAGRAGQENERIVGRKLSFISCLTQCKMVAFGIGMEF